MLSRLQRLLFTFSLVLACTVCAAIAVPDCLAAEAEQGTELQAFSVPAKTSVADIAHVLRFVARNREWFIEHDEVGYLRISLKSRGTGLVLAFHYDETKLTMRCLSRTDAPKNDRSTRWINNLAKDIRQQLAAKR